MPRKDWTPAQDEIEAVLRKREAPMHVKEIAASVGKNCPHVRRILTTMMAGEKVEKVEQSDGFYRIPAGGGAFQLPRQALARPPNAARIARACSELSLWLAQYKGPSDDQTAVRVTLAKLHLETALRTP